MLLAPSSFPDVMIFLWPSVFRRVIHQGPVSREFAFPSRVEQVMVVVQLTLKRRGAFTMSLFKHKLSTKASN